jgi:hypothetical protein
VSEEKPKLLIDPNRMSRMCEKCGAKRGFFVMACPWCGELWNYLEIDKSDLEREAEFNDAARRQGSGANNATERPEGPHP